MQRKWFVLLGAVMALAATPAAAQVVDPGDPMGGDGDSTGGLVTGNAEEVAHSMLLGMQLEKKQQDLCWEMGCLVIVNESPTYEVTQFLVQDPRRGRWSDNQFGAPLRPKSATFRFKSGGPDACDLPVRFQLRNPTTKAKLTLDGRLTLCKQPQRDSLVRIRVLTPTVEVLPNTQ
ncbi:MULTISPECIES: hypothetical protein [Sphingomonas]|uniref:hypothetical protein n=1 Tax=Sphingomonas TaxID=13687 RepID=UPI00126A6A13|nr:MULTISPECIES: hypothetical protein [Sphingomonas]